MDLALSSNSDWTLLVSPTLPPLTVLRRPDDEEPMVEII